jgi:hypothetical protein
MPQENSKNPLAIVTACMRADGTPTFAYQIVEVTSEEVDNGVQYYLAEAQLLEDGYEEPFVHFGLEEAPPFLHEAVRLYLGLSPVTAELSSQATLSEDQPCRA